MSRHRTRSVARIARTGPWLVVLLIAVTGCPHRVEVFSPDLDPAERTAQLEPAAQRPDAPASVLTELGWLRLLHGGRVAEAVTLFERAREEDDAGWRLHFGAATAWEMLARPDRAAEPWAAALADDDAPEELRHLAGWRLLAEARRGRLPAEVTRRVGRALDAGALHDAALAADLRGPDAGGDGTVRDWTVSDRLHPLPHLGFVRTAFERPEPPRHRARTDEESVLRFHPQDQGVYAAEARVSAPAGGQAALLLETRLSARVFVDGELVLERDAVTGYPPERRTVQLRLSPGEHLLRVEAAVDAPAEGVRLRWLPVAPGAAGGGFAAFEPAVLYHWIRAWRLHEEGAALGAAAALDAAKHLAPASAALAWLEAAVAGTDPTVPPGIAAERESDALRAAVDRDDTLAAAHAALARHLLQDGRADDALTHIRLGEAASPEAPAWDRLRHVVFVERSWEPEARAALDRARARQPDSCELARARLELDWETLRLHPWEPVPESRRRCTVLERGRAAHLLQSGLPLEAAAVFRKMLERGVGRVADRRGLADALLVGGRYDEALRVLEELRDERPGDLERGLTLAEAWRLAGDPTRAEQERGRLDARPEGDPEVRRKLLYLTKEPFWRSFVVDGAAWTARSREAGERLGHRSDAVILLDQQVSRFFGDGSGLHRAHTIILLRNRRGTEMFGEVPLPEGVELIFARTLKADGTVEEPEELAEKSTLSMPALEPGDAIEYALLRATPPATHAAPDLLSDAYYLQSYAAPILRSEWTVLADPKLPLVFDQRGSLPEPIVRRVGDLRAWSWRRNGSDQVRAEPSIPDARAALPSVRVGTLAWDDLAARQADTVLSLLRRGPRVTKLAREIGAGASSPLQRAGRAFFHVMAAIEDPGDRFLEVPAAHALAEGLGERYLVLLALLAELDVPAELVLAKPLNRTEDDGPLPDPLAYTYPLLRLTLDEGEVWLDPSLRYAPFDYVPPVVQDRPALSLSATRPGERLTTPRYPDERELHEVRLALRVERGGAAVRGEGHEVIRGIQAIALREILHAADESRRVHVIGTLVRASVPGARLSELRIGALDDVTEPLDLRYHLRAPLSPPRVPGPPQRVILGLLPEGFSANYAQLSRREQPLFFNRRLEQTFELTVSFPASATLAHRPRGTEIDNRFGRLTSRIWTTRTDAGEQQLHVRKSLHLPVRVVPPADYAAFAGSCRMMDRAETMRLDVRWRR